MMDASASGRAAGDEKQMLRRRMAAQPGRDDWLAAADVVVPNHGAINHLEKAAALLGDYLLRG